MPIPRRILTSAVLAALAMFGLGVGAAAAAAPTPAPLSTNGSTVIVYDGTANSSGAGYNQNFPARFTVDCAAQPCTISGYILDTDNTTRVSITGSTPLPFVGGSGTYTIAPTGGPCDNIYIPTFTETITASGSQVSSVFDIAGAGTVDCGNSTIVYGDGHVSITATVTTGDTCYIFESCPTPTPTLTAIAIPFSGTSPAATSNISGTTISSPSTLSTLPTLASAISVANTAWAAAVTTVLVVLIALPSHLINVSVEQGADRFTEWWRKRRTTPDARPESASKEDAAVGKPVRFAGWPLAAGGLLIASLISSFVSPTFGFNASSIRVFFSILVSFLIEAAAGWFIVIWLVRRTTPNVTAGFRFVPITLVIVAAAVVFSRLTGFQPGIVFGLVAGVIFGSALAVADRARVALVPLAYSFCAALVAWVVYSVMALFVGGHPGALVVFIQETLSAVTIAGIAALPIALVPLRGLAGYDVFHWNRWVWGAAYGVGMFGFFFVLMPKPFSWGTVGLSIWVWIILFVLYALIGVGLWLVVMKPWKKQQSSKETVDETAPVG